MTNTSIAILAETAIKHLCLAAQRETVSRLATEYGFDMREACEKLGLGEEKGDDMIAELLNDQTARTSSGTSSPTREPIQRKHASRLSTEERTEASRSKKEQKAAEKAAKNAGKLANKVEKAADKALAKAVKIAEKAVKKKRAPSAYLLFSNETRVTVKTEEPEMAAKEVMKELARRWKGLTDEEKAPWQQKAQEAKEALEKTEEALEKTEKTFEKTEEEMTVEEYLGDELENELEVKKQEIRGVTCLVAPSTNQVFDRESQEEIGMYDAEKDEIVRGD
jgi:hypothetical protein